MTSRYAFWYITLGTVIARFIERITKIGATDSKTTDWTCDGHEGSGAEREDDVQTLCIRNAVLQGQGIRCGRSMMNPTGRGYSNPATHPAGRESITVDPRDIDWNQAWKERRARRTSPKRDASFWDGRAASFLKAAAERQYADQFLAIMQPKTDWSVLDMDRRNRPDIGGHRNGNGSAATPI